MKRVIIIGGSVSGVTCALTLIANDKNLDITIIESSSYIAKQTSSAQSLISKQCELSQTFFTTKQIVEEQNIKILLKTCIISINQEAKLIATNDCNLPYDYLVIATGTKNTHTFDSQRFIPFNTVEGLQKLQNFEQQSVAIIGGGISGVEIASAFAERKVKTLLITDKEKLCTSNFDIEFSNQIEKLLKINKVEVVLNQKVTKIVDVQNHVEIITTKEKYEVDCYINCTGITPNVDFLKDIVKRNDEGAIIVDKTQCTSVPKIYAIGDCATVYSNLIKQDIFAPSAQLASKSAISCACTILGKPLPMQGTQNTKCLNLFGYYFCATGNPLHILSAPSAKRVKISDNHRAEFMPSFEVVSMQLTYDEESRAIYGSQIFSKHDISSYINALSLAIQRNLKIEQMLVMDFFFQPYFGKPWHMINLACMATIGLPPFEQYKIRNEGQEEIQ
ncbi:NADH oxidase [Spironucleus salmonicida]|uniref:NADH oxidase n=1 Tax=Spironucleus salmonicida TaxID=348837 RepID=V6LLZ7_9EUKA|nr:NADH oxidase [Spironucleus salmonicida]|eukprot:EST45712.1 NADH oxidase [Spironucleus salmonicida]